MIRFNRQKLFFSMISDDLSKKKTNNTKNILILGLGGIGANVALSLVRSGFKKLTVVDYDKVELSNLIRQFPYSKKDVGKYKTETLKTKLENEEKVRINCINKKIVTGSDIEDEIKKSDFVVCTLDKPSRIIRRIINEICVKYNKPIIFSGFSEHVAMVGPLIVPKKSACLKCMDKHMNEEPLNNVQLVPSYGPLCMFISSMVTNEIINYYNKFNSSNLIGKTLMFNILTYESKIVKWKRKINCEVCSKNDCK